MQSTSTARGITRRSIKLVSNTSSACFSAIFGCWNNLPMGVKSEEENSVDDVSDVVTGVVGSMIDGTVYLTDRTSERAEFF